MLNGNQKLLSTAVALLILIVCAAIWTNSPHLKPDSVSAPKTALQDSSVFQKTNPSLIDSSENLHTARLKEIVSTRGIAAVFSDFNLELERSGESVLGRVGLGIRCVTIDSKFFPDVLEQMQTENDKLGFLFASSRYMLKNGKATPDYFLSLRLPKAQFDSLRRSIIVTLAESGRFTEAIQIFKTMPKSGESLTAITNLVEKIAKNDPKRAVDLCDELSDDFASDARAMARAVFVNRGEAAGLKRLLESSRVELEQLKLVSEVVNAYASYGDNVEASKFIDGLPPILAEKGKASLKVAFTK